MAAPDRQEIVTNRWWPLSVALGLILGMIVMTLSILPDASEAWLCCVPTVPVVLVAMGVGAITRRVIHIDREGLTVAWEPYGLVMLDLPAQDITMVTLERVERRTFDIQEYWVSTDTIESTSVHVHLRDGSEKAVVTGYDPRSAKTVADQIRAVLRL